MLRLSSRLEDGYVFRGAGLKRGEEMTFLV